MPHLQDMAATKAAFDRDGFVLLESFFNAEQITAINDRVDQYIATILPTLPSDEAFYEIKDQPESIMRLQNICLLYTSPSPRDS